MSGPFRAMHITTSLLKPYPLLAIGLLSHMYSRSLKKNRNTTSIKEMNSTCKRNRKENGLAFIASQLCLRCIIIKIQFSSSKKPIRNILYPLFTHKEANITSNCPASCRKCHTNLQWQEQESHRLSESSVKAVSAFRK